MNENSEKSGEANVGELLVVSCGVHAVFLQCVRNYSIWNEHITRDYREGDVHANFARFFLLLSLLLLLLHRHLRLENEPFLTTQKSPT